MDMNVIQPFIFAVVKPVWSGIRLDEPVKQFIPFLDLIENLRARLLIIPLESVSFPPVILREDPGLVDGDVAIVVKDKSKRLHGSVVIHIIDGSIWGRGMYILSCLPADEQIGAVPLYHEFHPQADDLVINIVARWLVLVRFCKFLSGQGSRCPLLSAPLEFCCMSLVSGLPGVCQTFRGCFRSFVVRALGGEGPMNSHSCS